jgi:hypothetical protein
MSLRLIAFVTGLLLAFSTPAGIRLQQAAVAATPAPPRPGSLRLFTTETAAQARCPRDVVVWLNTASGIYHLKGQRWYAHTRQGAFVCEREADAAGDRETKNGQ